MSGWRGKPKTDRAASQTLAALMTDPASVPGPTSLRDSRRLTGPNLLWDKAGAVIDVTLDDATGEAGINRWAQSARLMLEAVGWPGEAITVRRFPGGASLAISAPLDGLYPATELNEWAWAQAQADHHPPPAPLEEEAARLRQRIADERNPRLMALAAMAAERGLLFLADDDLVSAGVGNGSHTWSRSALPDPASIDWKGLHNNPIVLITGSNGKTTTTRLITAMVESAGLVPGTASTDGVRISGETVESGDFAGPGGARMVLRDRRVELAILETARGGILRRGLAARHADAAIITNVAEDHLGEFGVWNLATLAETKMVVTRALGPGDPLVLNADDAGLVESSRAWSGPIIWFSLRSENPIIATHISAGGTAVFLEKDRLVLEQRGERRPIERLANIPVTLGGAARHNIANALGAIGLAAALHLPVGAIAQALRSFQGTAGDNPGRLNIYQLGGVTVVVDFAHNPHGLSALIEMAQALPAKRRLVLLGQAGDRDDEAIRQLARIAWRLKPDRIIAKEMAEYIRGRSAGEIPGLIEGELMKLGATRQQVERAPTELDGVQQALRWARPEDLLLLTVHAQREEVLALLDRLRSEKWKPGMEL